jgi:membrane protease YdiL (CAAX protease family)
VTTWVDDSGATVRGVVIPRAALALCGLGSALVARMLIAGADGASSLKAGSAFAALLVVIALLSGWRPPKVSSTALGVGLVGALVLAIGPVMADASGHRSVVPPPWGHFAPWALVVTAVALSEEMVMRGTLFDDLLEEWGGGVALLVTTLVFALLHLPLYGWRALPLDVAVGSLLGLLRLSAKSQTAPMVTHVLADLMSWWL